MRWPVARRGTPLTCDDADVCNGLETCDAVNGCEAGTPLVADDANACTTDSCDPISGIGERPVANGSASDDSDRLHR